MFTRVTGLGNYQVASNSLLTNNGAPMFSPSREGMIVRHREYIRDVNGASSFTNTSTLLNPANGTLFPWLSNLAKNFETFQWRGLLFYYNPTSGSISSTQSLGTVILSTNYDVLNAAFASKSEAEAYQFTTSCVPSSEMTHPIECKPSAVVSPRMYITDVTSLTDLPAHADPRLYFTGLMQQMVVGCPSTEALGELWVSYEVEFFTPKKPGALSEALTATSYCYDQKTILSNPSASWAPGQPLYYPNESGLCTTVAAAQGSLSWFDTPTITTANSGWDKRSFVLRRDGIYSIRYGEQWAGGGVGTAVNSTPHDWNIVPTGTGVTVSVFPDGPNAVPYPTGLFSDGSNILASDTIGIYDIYRGSGHITVQISGIGTAVGSKFVKIGCPYVEVAGATLSTSAETVGRFIFRCTQLSGTDSAPVNVYPPTSVSARTTVAGACPQQRSNVSVLSREAQRGLVTKLLDIIKDVDADASTDLSDYEDEDGCVVSAKPTCDRRATHVSQPSPFSLPGIMNNLRVVRQQVSGNEDQKSVDLTAALSLFERQIKAAYGDDSK
jgi:hypothetical protein